MQFTKLLNAISNYHQPIILAEGVAIFLMIILLIIALSSLRKIAKHYFILPQGPEAKDLEQLFKQHLQRVDELEFSFKKLDQFYKDLRESHSYSVQQVGLVRFNAFDNVGGELSFSVALLDAHKNGIVLTSLYGREEFRCYAKPIEGGNSSYPLSGEEKEALAKALGEKKQ